MVASLTDFLIHGPLLATDDDADQELRFHLRESERPAGVQIDPKSGFLSVRRRWIDFEQEQSLRFIAEVYDAFGLSDSVAAKIDLVDSNDAPVARSRNFAMAENPGIGDVIGRFETDSVETLEKCGVSIIDSDCPFSNNLRVQTPSGFNFEASPIARCVVVITDDAPLPRSSYTTVFVRISDVNEVPELISEQRGYISESASRGEWVMSVNANDPDTEPTWSSLRYRLLNTSIFVVGHSTGEVSLLSPGVLDFETKSEHILQVQVTDGGLLTAESTVFVSVVNVEEAPEVLSTYTVIISENGVAPRSLLLINATDPDRISLAKLRFSLVEITTKFSIGETTGELVLLKPLDYEYNRLVNLTVNVAKLGSALNTNSTVSIVVTNVNEAPELIEGTSVELVVPENLAEGVPIGAALSSAIWDPENDTLSYVLDSSEYSPFFTLEACTGQLRSRKPLDFEATPNTFVLLVSVYDSDKSRFSFPVSVSVLNVNEPPAFSQAPFILTVGENKPSKTVVGIITALDPDSNDELAYSIRSKNDNMFEIDPSTGEINVSPTGILDYETQASHALQVCATDLVLETCVEVLVFIIDINEPPACRPEVRFVAENTPTGAVITPAFESFDGDRTDLGRYPTYTIIDSDSIGEFHFENSSLVVDSLALDFEARDLYSFGFTSCDAAGACSMCTLTIHISDINEAPVISNQVVQVNERTNTTFYMVQAYDPDFNQTSSLLYEIQDQFPLGVFSLDATSGVVKAADPTHLDFEAIALHQAWINVRVTDKGVPPLSSVGQLVIQIQDINDAPTSASTVDISIMENTTVGTVVFVWSVQDEDAGQQMTYQLMQDGCTGIFGIRDSSIPEVTLETSLNYEAIVHYDLVLQACDPFVLCTTSVLQIAVEDNNEEPSFVLGRAAQFKFSVASHASAGSVIGCLQAFDPDVLSFSLLTPSRSDVTGTRNGVGVFAVNQQTGELKVASSESEMELQTGYDFLLIAQVTDSRMLSATSTVVVNVVAHNAPPGCSMEISFTMEENSRVGTLVGGPLSAYVTDADIGTIFAFSLEHPFLSVSPNTGQLAVTSEPNLDFESAAISTTMASVVVTDDGANHNGINTLSTSCLVSIIAADVNERPETSNLSLIVAEGTSTTAS